MADIDWSKTQFETRAIHDGQEPEEQTGAVIVPIYQTSTYAQTGIGEHKGFEYARTDNPTRTALQTSIASLEGGEWGLAYGSGMAAIQNILYMLVPGDHVLMSDDAYGGTFRLIDKIFARYGIEYSMVDLSDLEQVREGLRDDTKMIISESPTNPYLKIVDIAGVSQLIHERYGVPSGEALSWEAGTRGFELTRPILLVDNTFASPYLQTPLAHGADLVVHSATKYLGGHSDVVLGLVVGNDASIQRFMKFHQNAAGAVPGPFDCWLVLRGLKTLGIRMREHSANAMRIAEWLMADPAIKDVYYPGLAGHHNHEVAKRQMRAYSGMVSFSVHGGWESASRVVAATKVFTLAESLGGVESLIEHPGQMTHLSTAGSKAEVGEDLIRLSVGIEHIDDLIADLEQALEVAVPAGARA
ncbi:MAG TPA: cystathionine gamma-synthase [Thermomicrobiales bacterium]|nr:cystathionine gamma-synthase [Thermomicrobiales bacterium]